MNLTNRSQVSVTLEHYAEADPLTPTPRKLAHSLSRKSQHTRNNWRHLYSVAGNVGHELILFFDRTNT